jgi:hypothetical protein
VAKAIAVRKRRGKSVPGGQSAVIITGMHRSGTSLVASILQRAGLNIGGKLLGPAKGNRRGHFEDIDFLQFHERALARRGHQFLIRETKAIGALLPDEFAEARKMIAERRSHALWGWKDPRTCLFLNFWHRLLPQAKYIFAFRHPLEVLLSLLRRGTDLSALRDYTVGINAWQIYNMRIMEFYRLHQESSFLCDISSVVDDVGAFVRALSRKLELPLRAIRGEELYSPGELRQMHLTRAIDRFCRHVIPDSGHLYDRMSQSADLRVRRTRSGSELDQAITTLVDKFVRPEAIPKNKQRRIAALQLLAAALDPEAVEGAHKVLEDYICRLEREMDSLNGDLAELRNERDNLINEADSLRRQMMKSNGSASEARLAAYKAWIEARRGKLLIWGTGEGARRVASALSMDGHEYLGFVDPDPEKTGQKLLDHPVFNPAVLTQLELQPPFIVIGSIYHEQIATRLETMGLIRDTHFVVSPLSEG